MQTARNSTQLLQRECDLAPRLIEPRLRVRISGELLLQATQLERKSNQPLLSAVMKVAFQPLPLLLPGLDHPRARTPKLLQVRPLLGM